MKAIEKTFGVVSCFTLLITMVLGVPSAALGARCRCTAAAASGNLTFGLCRSVGFYPTGNAPHLETNVVREYPDCGAASAGADINWRVSCSSRNLNADPDRDDYNRADPPFSFRAGFNIYRQSWSGPQSYSSEIVGCAAGTSSGSGDQRCPPVDSIDNRGYGRRVENLGALTVRCAPNVEDPAHSGPGGQTSGSGAPSGGLTSGGSGAGTGGGSPVAH